MLSTEKLHCILKKVRNQCWTTTRSSPYIILHMNKSDEFWVQVLLPVYVLHMRTSAKGPRRFLLKMHLTHTKYVVKGLMLSEKV